MASPPLGEGVARRRAVYGVALLSNAMHQDNYARTFDAHPRLRIVAVIDEPGQERYVAERNRSIAERYDVPLLDSLAALARPEIDAVSIGAQIERRGRLALAAARAGKHLWLDKPPAALFGEVDALASAVDQTGVTTLVVSHLAAAWVEELRVRLRGGAIGDVLGLHIDYHFAKGAANGLADRRVPAGGGPRDVWTFRDAGAATDPTESSHNVIAKRELAEVGWYALALVHRLAGQPVRRVFATAGAYLFPEHRDLGIEDFATVNLLLDGGPVVTISTGRTGRQSHPSGRRAAVRAVGTRGTLVADGASANADPTGSTPIVGRQGAAAGAAPMAAAARPGDAASAIADPTGMFALASHFVECLDGTASSMLTARDGASLMRVLDAAYASIASGEPVTL